MSKRSLRSITGMTLPLRLDNPSEEFSSLRTGVIGIVLNDFFDLPNANPTLLPVKWKMEILARSFSYPVTCCSVVMQLSTMCPSSSLSLLSQVPRYMPLVPRPLCKSLHEFGCSPLTK